jgi:hypothetical protein
MTVEGMTPLCQRLAGSSTKFIDISRARTGSFLSVLFVTAHQPYEKRAGRVMLAERSPEELAAVLVLRRELLPAPEVLDDPGSIQSEVRSTEMG